MPRKKTTSRKAVKKELVDFKESFVWDEAEARPEKDNKLTKHKNQKHMSKSRPISIYKKIAASFIVLTLMLVAAVVYFSVVSVTITIIPNRERTATNFIATVYNTNSESQAKIDVSDLRLPGIVEKISLNVADTFQATGLDVVDTVVTGVVTIINTSRRDQPLIATTRLLAPDGRLYRLKNTVRAPAGGSIDGVEVYADKASKEMEIGPTKFTIPGLSPSAQELIYAESKEKIAFQETGDALVSEADLARAKQSLQQTLTEKLAKMIEGKTYKMYDNLMYDVNETAIQYTTDVKAGDKVEQFGVVASVDAAIVGFSAKDVEQLALLKISEVLPDDKELLSFDKDNFVFSLDRYDLTNNTADVKVETLAQMVLKDNTDVIDPERLVGLTREQLDDYLSSLREVAGYEVKFTPSWITKVPALVDHVKVEVAK